MTNDTEIKGYPNQAQSTPERPRVTLALFAYNQQNHVQAAVEAALEQDYDGPLEIILSDDGSHDDTFAVMQKVAHAYDGPHHVRLNRNDCNLGIAVHVNRVFAMAQGDIFVLAAGDDISLASRVRHTTEVFARHPRATAVSFSDIRVDEQGNVIEEQPAVNEEKTLDLNLFLASKPKDRSNFKLSGASRAIRRIVYDTFGPLEISAPTEDTPYLFRSLFVGDVVVCGWPAILYRVHPLQMSSEEGITKQIGKLFFDQITCDCKKAYKRQLTTVLNVVLVYKLAMDMWTHRETLKKSFDGSIPNLTFVIRFVLSDGLSTREKMGIIKRFITRSPIRKKRHD